MDCPKCQNDPCTCGYLVEGSTAKPTGQTLRLTRCDVPGCHRIVSAGDPEKNLALGLKLPTRCRFHRDPTYSDPITPEPIRILPDTGPPLSLDEFGREEFDRIRKAAGQEVRAYWSERGIVVTPPGPVPKGWESAGKTLRRWADKWFPPIS